MKFFMVIKRSTEDFCENQFPADRDGKIANGQQHVSMTNKRDES